MSHIYGGVIGSHGEIQLVMQIGDVDLYVKNREKRK